MNTRNVIVKIAFGAIATLVIVLVGLLIYQQRLIKQMAGRETPAPSATEASADPAGIQAETAPERAAVSAGPEHPESEIEALQYHLDQTEEELEMAREDLANELDKQEETTSNFVEMQRKALENPTTRKVIRSSIETAMDATYGALFQELGLSEGEVQAFKALLSDHQMAAMETTFDMMGEELSMEEKLEAAHTLEARNAEFEGQVSDLLGSEKFQVYENYQERLAERQYAATFTESLGEDGGLTEAQEKELVEALYQARKKIETEYGTESEVEEMLDPTGAMDRQLEQMGRLFESYTESARDVLSESQAQQFEAQMSDQQEMIKASIEMARSLYGGSSGGQ